MICAHYTSYLMLNEKCFLFEKLTSNVEFYLQHSMSKVFTDILVVHHVTLYNSFVSKGYMWQRCWNMSFQLWLFFMLFIHLCYDKNSIKYLQEFFSGCICPVCTIKCNHPCHNYIILFIQVSKFWLIQMLICNVWKFRDNILVRESKC